MNNFFLVPFWEFGSGKRFVKKLSCAFFWPIRKLFYMIQHIEKVKVITSQSSTIIFMAYRESSQGLGKRKRFLYLCRRGVPRIFVDAN